MKNRKSIATFAPHELQRFIVPITLAFVCIIAGVIIAHLVNDSPINIGLLVYGGFAILYSLINNVLIVRTNNYRETYGLLNSILSGIGLGIFLHLVPEYI